MKNMLAGLFLLACALLYFFLGLEITNNKSISAQGQVIRSDGFVMGRSQHENLFTNISATKKGPETDPYRYECDVGIGNRSDDYNLDCG